MKKNKLIIFILGNPNQGKTFLGNHLKSIYNNSDLIHIDCVFLNWLDSCKTSEDESLKNMIYNVYDLFEEKDWYNHVQEIFESMDNKCVFKFGMHLRNIIKEFNSNNNNVIIIEGWALTYYRNIIKETEDLGQVIMITAINKEYIIDENKFLINEIHDVIKNG